MKNNYVLGIDFGTLSARALLLDAQSGAEVAESTCAYAHGVMDEVLPNGKHLPPKYALQHPRDYIEALQKTVADVLRFSGVPAEQIVGVGIDFTTCTWLPIDQDATPLCLLPKYEDEPHAYVKLWKHHGATACAEQIDRVALARSEKWFAAYDNKSSSEWALAKTLETLQQAPQVFEDTYRFLEAADWLSLLLTGRETHSLNFAGIKAFYNADCGGFPSNDFMKAVDPRLDGIIGGKIGASVHSLPDIAGRLSKQGAALIGLVEGTPLALPLIDAHAAIPGVNVTGEGEMLIIIGTSSVQMLNAKKATPVPGMCGYAKDGIMPGYYIYESSQSGVGDSFDWFVKNCVPARYEQEAKQKGVSVHAHLREKASRLAPGESGLLALDWWNGSRSPLKKDSVAGTVLGMTLATKPEEIYRALIEATAYGTRSIIEGYKQGGFEIKSICAAGGIAQKDPMLMQIYADVTGHTIRVAGTAQAGARGSAVCAAVAGGLFKTLPEAAAHFATPDHAVYTPNAEHCAVYDELYAEYRRLHDYFGYGENPVMDRLFEISRAQKSK